MPGNRDREPRTAKTQGRWVGNVVGTAHRVVGGGDTSAGWSRASPLLSSVTAWSRWHPTLGYGHRRRPGLHQSMGNRALARFPQQDLGNGEGVTRLQQSMGKRELLLRSCGSRPLGQRSCLVGE